MIEANSAKTNAVSIAIKPASKKATHTAGPAVLAATPLKVNKPDPSVFPNPSMTSAVNVYVGSNFVFFLD